MVLGWMMIPMMMMMIGAHTSMMATTIHTLHTTRIWLGLTGWMRIHDGFQVMV